MPEKPAGMDSRKSKKTPENKPFFLIFRVDSGYFSNRDSEHRFLTPQNSIALF
ncbi:MAG: hypothetical protein LBU34_08455 [Planctomycetaceae bacterium]|nr:hypothetical protein [Planctomycetaceae bacterium]